MNSLSHYLSVTLEASSTFICRTVAWAAANSNQFRLCVSVALDEVPTPCVQSKLHTAAMAVADQISEPRD